MQVKGDLIQAVIAFCHADSEAAVQAQRDAILRLIEERPEGGAIDRMVPHETVDAVLAGRTAPLNGLSDRQLSELNGLLPWGAMTVDAGGRVLGSAWSSIKRNRQSPLIDQRLKNFDAHYPIAGKRVLEVGCFEGIHTIGNLALGASVTAVDSRIENILKTLTRLWAYGLAADVRVWDLEQPDVPAGIPADWDMLHHVGVLYHQTNPAESLAQLVDRTREAILLDTHVAQDAETATGSYEALGRTFRYEHQVETSISPFAGMKDHAKWLLTEDLEWICTERGFRIIRSEVRQERNGARAMIWAVR
jgi:SAM-dependent methyltransferase